MVMVVTLTQGYLDRVSWKLLLKRLYLITDLGGVILFKIYDYIIYVSKVGLTWL